MHRKDRGFTLVEALSAMAIVVVGITIGVPSFTGVRGRQRTETAMHLLSADMAMARGTAVMKQAQVVVCPGDASGCVGRDWANGWVVFVDEDKDRRIGGATDLLRIESARSDSSLTLPATRDFLRFQADGRSANANLTVQVCSGGVLKGQVVVNNLGRVRTERPKRETACLAR